MNLKDFFAALIASPREQLIQPEAQHHFEPLEESSEHTWHDMIADDERREQIAWPRVLHEMRPVINDYFDNLEQKGEAEARRIFAIAEDKVFERLIALRVIDTQPVALDISETPEALIEAYKKRIQDVITERKQAQTPQELALEKSQ